MQMNWTKAEMVEEHKLILHLVLYHSCNKLK